MQGHWSLLFHAVSLYKFDAFKALLAAGAKAKLTNRRGATVLFLIVKRNLLDWAVECVRDMEKEERIKFINEPELGGWSPLILAAHNGLTEMVWWLHCEGACINNSSNRSWSPLHAAVKNGNRQVVEFLLQNGADQDIEAIHPGGKVRQKAEDVTSDHEIKILLYKYRSSSSKPIETQHQGGL